MVNSDTSKGTQESYDLDQDYSSSNVDIKRFISLFISNWYWFAIALFISFTLAYCINRYSQKLFSITSTLLIKDDQNGGLGPATSSVIPGGDIFRSQQNVKNEIEILKSFKLNLLVMNELTDFHVMYYRKGRRNIVESLMYKDCPFKVVYDSLSNQNKRARVNVSFMNKDELTIEIVGYENSKTNLKIGETFKGYGLNFSIEPRDKALPVFSAKESNNYYFYFMDPARLANIYRSKLIVAPKDRESSVVSLIVNGNVFEQEADYLNKLMEVYIKYGLEQKNEIAEKTLEFINRQLDIISDSLENASSKLENFRISNNFIELKSEISMVQDRLINSYEKRASIELQLQYFNYLSEYINSRYTEGTVVSPSFVDINDQRLISLIDEYSSIQKKRNDLNFNLETNQDVIKYYGMEINKVQESIKENIINNLERLKQTQANLLSEIKKTEAEFKRLPSTEKKFVEIQRSFELNNTIYTYLLEKRAESGIAQASTMADNRPVDAAFLRGQVKPKNKNNYMIALVLGLVLPGSLIFAIDFFNNKVMDKNDVMRITKVPIVGYIGHSESKSEIAVIEKASSALSESFRSVRTSLKYYIKEGEVAVIAVSSTISSEGKTFVSLNLAAIISMLGKKVLLIGLDMRKPRLNKALDFNNNIGMSTYLSGNCKYDEIVRTTKYENLFYVPSGPVPPNPAELIETPGMAEFMNRAKKEYDFIIFDTPPVAIVTDALLLGSFADINLFIVRQRYSSINTLDLIEQLRKHGELKNMAILLNDISLSGYYGYGLRYGYNYGYGYSYGSAYYGSNYYGKHGYKENGHGYYIDN